MKAQLLRVVLQSLLLLFGAASMPQAQEKIVEPADIIVVRGRIYTENSKQPWAQAVAIRNDKIVAVGDDAEIERTRGGGTKVIDAARKLVPPGFVDWHIPFLDASFNSRRRNPELAS